MRLGRWRVGPVITDSINSVVAGNVITYHDCFTCFLLVFYTNYYSFDPVMFCRWAPTCFSWVRFEARRTVAYLDHWSYTLKSYFYISRFPLFLFYICDLRLIIGNRLVRRNRLCKAWCRKRKENYRWRSIITNGDERNGHKMINA